MSAASLLLTVDARRVNVGHGSRQAGTRCKTIICGGAVGQSVDAIAVTEWRGWLWWEFRRW